MRILLHRNQQALLAECFDDEVDRRRVGRPQTGERAEAFEKASLFIERSDTDEAQGRADLMVDISATGGRVNNPRPLPRDDVRIPLEVASAIDDGVTRNARLAFQLQVFWQAPVSRLSRQHIERPAISRPDQFGPFHDRFDFVAALLLQNLPQRFQLGAILGPLPLGTAKPLLELFGEPLVVEVFLRAVVDRAIFFHAEFGVVEFRVDHRRHVARQRPGRRRPDQHMLVFDLFP